MHQSKDVLNMGKDVINPEIVGTGPLIHEDCNPKKISLDTYTSNAKNNLHLNEAPLQEHDKIESSSTDQETSGIVTEYDDLEGL